MPAKIFNGRMFTTSYSYGSDDKEYLFCCKGRPFVALVSPNLPTPSSSLIDFDLIRKMGLTMTDIQCKKLYFGGHKMRILGRVSTAVQCVKDGRINGNFHIKGLVIADLYQMMETHCVAGARMQEKLAHLAASHEDDTDEESDEELLNTSLNGEVYQQISIPMKSSPSTAVAVKSSPSTASAMKSSPSTASAVKSSPSTASAVKSSPSTASAVKSSPSTASAVKSSPSTASAVKSSPSTASAAKSSPSTAMAMKSSPSFATTMESSNPTAVLSNTSPPSTPTRAASSAPVSPSNMALSPDTIQSNRVRHVWLEKDRRRKEDVQKLWNNKPAWNKLKEKDPEYAWHLLKCLADVQNWPDWDSELTNSWEPSLDDDPSELRGKWLDFLEETNPDCLCPCGFPHLDYKCRKPNHKKKKHCKFCCDDRKMARYCS